MSVELLVPLRPVLVSVLPVTAVVGDTVILAATGHLYTYDGASWVDNGAGATAGIGAIVAGTQTVTSGSVSFSNSNGITFGMSNTSVITASFAVNISAGTTNNSLAAVSFANSNGVSFGLNAGTVTASVSVAAGNAGFARMFLLMGG
jgi:hypothetical protein